VQKKEEKLGLGHTETAEDRYQRLQEDRQQRADAMVMINPKDYCIRRGDKAIIIADDIASARRVQEWDAAVPTELKSIVGMTPTDKRTFRHMNGGRGPLLSHAHALLRNPQGEVLRVAPVSATALLGLSDRTLGVPGSVGTRGVPAGPGSKFASPRGGGGGGGGLLGPARLGLPSMSTLRMPGTGDRGLSAPSTRGVDEGDGGGIELTDVRVEDGSGGGGGGSGTAEAAPPVASQARGRGLSEVSSSQFGMSTGTLLRHPSTRTLVGGLGNIAGAVGVVPTPGGALLGAAASPALRPAASSAPPRQFFPDVPEEDDSAATMRDDRGAAATPFTELHMGAATVVPAHPPAPVHRLLDSAHHMDGHIIVCGPGVLNHFLDMMVPLCVYARAPIVVLFPFQHEGEAARLVDGLDLPAALTTQLWFVSGSSTNQVDLMRAGATTAAVVLVVPNEGSGGEDMAGLTSEIIGDELSSPLQSVGDVETQFTVCVIESQFPACRVLVEVRTHRRAGNGAVFGTPRVPCPPPLPCRHATAAACATWRTSRTTTRYPDSCGHSLRPAACTSPRPCRPCCARATTTRPWCPFWPSSLIQREKPC